MKSKGMIALSSFLLLISFSGCSLTKFVIGSRELNQKVELPSQDWLGADIKSLPISDKPEVIAGFAKELCMRYASFGQKAYSLRLAIYAHNKSKRNKKIALTLARSAFMVADALEDEDLIKINAEIGLKAAKVAGAADQHPDPEACYYFAVNLGLIVRAKGLFALNKISKIADALKIAQKKPDIDRGGPLRVLGILYLKAPAWPSGIGDLDKALEILEEAVNKYPTHPQNFQFYAEALIEDDEKKKAMLNLKIAHELSVPEIWGVYYSKKWRNEINKLIKKHLVK